MESEGFEKDKPLIIAAEAALATKAVTIDQFFFDWGRNTLPSETPYDTSEFEAFREKMAGRSRFRTAEHDFWSDTEHCSMHIEEVEAIWEAIAQNDDWDPLSRKINEIRQMGIALREG